MNVGERKAARLLAATGGDVIHAAYGDTLADLAMLEASVTPIAVDPDVRLRRVAVARGWRVFSATG